MKPDQPYEVADLNAIIKSRQSRTPKGSEDSMHHEGEIRQQASSEHEYQSLKSQYTTNYMSTSHGFQKNTRTLRQQINIIRNEQHRGQFLAYCIVVKQSNLGIYSNERLITLDSHQKTLSYYSQVPNLPITDLSALPAPKETIFLATAKKFNYTPVKNGIGQVGIAWVDQGGSKEWRLTMSSRRVAKEFGILIETVKSNQHLIKKPVESAKKLESPPIDNKVNKKETPFIAELKKLQEQNKIANAKLSPSYKLKSEQIVNKDSEVKFTNIPIAQKMINTDDISNQISKQAIKSPKVEPLQPIKSSRVDTVNLVNQQSSKIKQQIIHTPVKSQETIKLERQQNKVKTELQKQNQKDDKAESQKNKSQIKMDDIIKQAEKQHSYMAAIRSPQSEIKRFAELENILNSRNNRQKYFRSSLNSHEGNRLSQKKTLVKKIEKATDETNFSQSRGDESKETEKAVTHKRQSRYEDSYNSFRMSLLQERRKVNEQANLPRGHPKRQSVRSRSNSVEETGRGDDWLPKWLQAGSRDQLAAIYHSFIAECEIRVKKIVGNCENWHLLHKNGQQFRTEQAGIEFQYFIFRENCKSEVLFKKEQGFLTKLRNWSYLLNFLHENNIHRFRVPLACVVDYKALKVFCRAIFHQGRLIYSLIEDIANYVQPLRKLEEKCKISLHRCELYEVILKDLKYIYFNELDALPKIKAGQQSIDSNYISLFIKEGVIRNQLDLEEITRHIYDKLLNKFLQRLNGTHLFSSTELDELLISYGLNSSFLGELYARAKQNKLEQAASYIISELAAIGLAESVRLGIHKFLLKQRRDGTVDTVCSVMQLFLQGNLVLKEELLERMRLTTKQAIEMEYQDIIIEYVTSSALQKLSIRCDFRNKLPFEQLEDLRFNIWASIVFSPDAVNLYTVTHANKYNYHNFINSSLLEQTIFKKRAELPEELTKDKILTEINPFNKEEYSNSPQFRLLPSVLKHRINFYLSHFSPPTNRNLGLSFDFQFSQLYFNLYQHSSAYIETHQSFSEDLIGIKWLIKRGRFEQADCKLIEQRQRIWLWGRHHSKALMEIHDIQSLYAAKCGRFDVAVERSLTALQLAIHFFGEKTDLSWQIIWEKAFFAADVHYKSNRFDQAADLYDTCISLSQRIKGQEMSAEQINQQFLQVYNKQAIIRLTQGRIQQCIQLIATNLQKLNEWKSYFSQRPKTNLLIKVDSEVYDAYRLLLRCNQIQQNYENFGAILSSVIYSYFQKDWNLLYLNNPKLKLTDTTKQRFSELIKNTWLYVSKNIEIINRKLINLGRPQIKQKLIYQHLENIRRENRGFYRYTTQQLFKYMVELVILRAEKEGAAPEKSHIVEMIIECLSYLSSDLGNYKRCRLYDQNSKENKLLLLQSMTHLAGYEFCMGVLQECFQEYTFNL